MRGKKDDLELLINEHDPDVIALSETWLEPGTSFFLNGFSISRKDRNDGHGGVLVACSTRLTAANLTITSSYECAGCSVNVDNLNTINIASIYLPPTPAISAIALDNLIHQIPAPKLVLGDFNAHGQQWGSPINDRRAMLIMSVFDDHDLSTLNTGEITRIACPPNRGSSIDLSVSSSNIALNCTWQVLDQTHGSDHLPILITYQHHQTSDPVPNHGDPVSINTNKVNWELFNHFVEIGVQNKVSDNMPPLTKYQVLTEIITESARAASPRPPQHGKRSRAPKVWWCPELSTLYEAKRIAFRQFQRIGGRPAYLAYRKSEAQFRLIKNQRKKEKWLEFCSSLNKDTSLTSMYAMARRFRGQGSTRQRDLNSGNWQHEFASILAPPTAPERVEWRYDNNPIDVLDNPFTSTELKVALSSCNNTAPGLDQISFPIIKKLEPHVCRLIVDLYNTFFATQQFPVQWKDCKVVAIPKPGKPTDEAKSYRPICLLPCLKKLFEKMLKTRIDHWIEVNHKSDPTQFGFRRGFGTDDCISILSTDIKQVYAQKYMCLAVFMDITAAYDNVKMDVLCAKLVSIQCSLKVVKTIYNLFKERRLFFYFNNRHLETRTGYKGLAQGSSLSPLLFNIYTRDIRTDISPNIKVLQYADDVVVYTSGNDHMTIQNAVQSAIETFTTSYKSLGLEISASKTEFMVFSKKYKLPSFRVRLDSIAISQSFGFKYLGVVFDPRSTWKQHVEHISKRCEKRINFMRTISGSTWGAHPEVLLLLYKSTIRPVLEYGARAFENMAKTHRIRLQRIQWRAIRVSFGLMSSTHTGSLEAISGVQPLDLRWRTLIDKQTMKSFASPSTMLRESIANLRLACPEHPDVSALQHLPSIEAQQLFPCYSFPLSDMLFVPSISWRLRENMSGNKFPHVTEVNDAFREAVTRINADTWVFTDGSKTPDGTGSAIYVNAETIDSRKLREPASIFDAELQAVHMALALIETKPAGTFAIASDSMSVLMALEKSSVSTSSSQLLCQCRANLHSLHKRSYQVVLLWIPAHCGIRGNEEADHLAKEATTDGSLSQVHPEWRSHFPNINTRYAEQWQSRWDTGELGRFCHSIIPRLKKKAWFKKFCAPLSRPELRTICRIASNHYALKNHLNRFNITDTSLCACGGYESVDHILFNCPNHQTHRGTLLQLVTSEGFSEPFSTRNILAASSNSDLASGIHTFLTLSDTRV